MFAFADFVKATTTTTGTGDITLGSSPTGFRSFAQGFSDQDVMDVLVVDNPSAPTQWEVFEATYNDLTTDTLTRGTLRSSSTGSRINFSAGTKTVVAAPSALFYNLIAQAINADIDATGSSGAYAVTTPAGLAPARGYRITFKANHDNPAGGTTINPDTLGADAIKLADGTDPYAGAIKQNGLYTVEFDGTNFQLLNPSGANGNLRRVTTITASGTYDKPAWLRFAIVEGVGGGGGGGGAASGGGQAIAGGGGAGGYFKFLVQASDLSASETVTIGAAGSGGSAGTNNGTNGGNTSFGSHATGNGGDGGAGASNGVGAGVSDGGVGGTVTYGPDAQRLTGTGARSGESGAAGIRIDGFLANYGTGGNTVFGAGGRQAGGNTGNGAGVPATGEGAGGSGARATDAAQAGGNGKIGIIYVYEYE